MAKIIVDLFVSQMAYSSKKKVNILHMYLQNYVKPSVSWMVCKCLTLTSEFCDAEELNPQLWIRSASAATTGGLSGSEGSYSTWAQVAITKRRCKET